MCIRTNLIRVDFHLFLSTVLLPRCQIKRRDITTFYRSCVRIHITARHCHTVLLLLQSLSIPAEREMRLKSYKFGSKQVGAGIGRTILYWFPPPGRDNIIIHPYDVWLTTRKCREPASFIPNVVTLRHVSASVFETMMFFFVSTAKV